MGIFDFLTKAAGFGAPEEAGGLSRKNLVEKVFAEFKRQLELETTELQLLFPASFTIYLSAADFDKRKSGFPFTVKELVNRFNREIRRRMRSGHSDYVAHSQFWYFKFNCFPEGGLVVVDGKSMESLAEGDVLIQCDLVPNQDVKMPPKDPSGRRVVSTIVDKGPVIQTTAINLQAVKGVTAKPGYTYIVEFANFEDLTSEEFSEAPAVARKKEMPRSYGRLEVLDGPSFIVDGHEVSEYEVTVPDLYLSGVNDASVIGGIPVLRIGSDEVVSTHIHLHADSPGVFKVRANGPVWAGGIHLDASTRESADLRPGDQIIIGDGIVVIQLKK